MAPKQQSLTRRVTEALVIIVLGLVCYFGFGDTDLGFTELDKAGLVLMVVGGAELVWYVGRAALSRA
ncbi:hypothetical protein [Streptomyces indicus]|uniref:Uncharacterized protein n=1 Tax=Streptomyces indicus TaxID=417292 RepID=A0A1G9EE62_9ACTN|nr:hypothetical protein [Streptomyces indicus]SDK74325.1 hypothetical protein SAMN05421806_111105 [Streptomyces indicus]